MARNLKKGTSSELSTNVKPKDSALREACMAGNLAVVKRIVTAGGADINSRDRFGMTRVQAAAWYGHKEVVEFLVSKGADVSLVDGAGNNIPHYACWGGDEETVKFVLSQNFADIKAKNKSGETATDRAGEMMKWWISWCPGALNEVNRMCAESVLCLKDIL